MVTASHVLGARKFSLNPNGTVNVEFQTPTVLHITDCNGVRSEISINGLENNPDAWLSDVAKIRTGNHTKFWLRDFDDRKSRPGEHLIAMGFPGLSFKALTIYTGILSARLTTTLPTVILDTGQTVTPPTEFLRVQMPISTGLSGAPIIDDENRVIGIVTNAGGWTRDLENLMLAFHGGAFPAQPPQPPATQEPNTISFSFNSMAVLAELAGLFHDYASPGYGDAVPLRYLKKPPQQNQPSASHDH
jgi:CBS domain-containing protein